MIFSPGRKDADFWWNSHFPTFLWISWFFNWQMIIFKLENQEMLETSWKTSVSNISEEIFKTLWFIDVFVRQGDDMLICFAHFKSVWSRIQPGAPGLNIRSHHNVAWASAPGHERSQSLSSRWWPERTIPHSTNCYKTIGKQASQIFPSRYLKSSDF